MFFPHCELCDYQKVNSSNYSNYSNYEYIYDKVPFSQYVTIYGQIYKIFHRHYLGDGSQSHLI